MIFLYSSPGLPPYPSTELKGTCAHKPTPPGCPQAAGSGVRHQYHQKEEESRQRRIPRVEEGFFQGKRLDPLSQTSNLGMEQGSGRPGTKKEWDTPRGFFYSWHSMTAVPTSETSERLLCAPTHLLSQLARTWDPWLSFSVHNLMYKVNRHTCKS